MAGRRVCRMNPAMSSACAAMNAGSARSSRPPAPFQPVDVSENGSAEMVHAPTNKIRFSQLCWMEEINRAAACQDERRTPGRGSNRIAAQGCEDSQARQTDDPKRATHQFIRSAQPHPASHIELPGQRSGGSTTPRSDGSAVAGTRDSSTRLAAAETNRTLVPTPRRSGGFRCIGQVHRQDAEAQPGSRQQQQSGAWS